jgi:hypothetical protein
MAKRRVVLLNGYSASAESLGAWRGLRELQRFI